MNGTYRKILKRIKDFRARAGRDYDTAWLSLENFHKLPEAVRHEQLGDKIGWTGPSPVLCHIGGVPVRVHEVLDPAWP